MKKLLATLLTVSTFCVIGGAANNNGTILDSDSASNTSLKSTTLSTSSYSTSATHGYWYAHCSNNQHSNEHFTYDGIDS